MSEEIKFLKELQEELKTQETDRQAAPRYWGIMNYRTVPGHEDYDTGKDEYFHNDGDHTKFESFEDLKEFLEEYHEEDVENDEDLREILGSNDFYDLWEYVQDNLNDDGYFSKVFVKEEEFIVTSAMFLTKTEAKRHLELNHYHYSPKAHTYAMTAWRAPKVERLLKVLETFDWDKVHGCHRGNTMINRVVLVGRLTKDPELKYTQSGIAVTRFTLAVNQPFKSDGEQKADFINCVAWRKVAENTANYLKKGSLAGVDGRIQSGSYEGQDGKRVYTTEVIADSVQFLEPRSASSDGGQAPRQTNTHNQTQNTQGRPEPSQEDAPPNYGEADLPF